LSAFFEATRQDYYQRLQAVSTGGDWEAWLLYCLNGMARQSEDALSRVERINALLGKWRLLVARTSSKHGLLLLDMLTANPFLTIKNAAEKLEVAFTTAQRAVEKLEGVGILSRVSEAKRDRVYCARPLLEILEEPARIVPSRTSR
jgi:Fic family protein